MPSENTQGEPNRGFVCTAVPSPEVAVIVAASPRFSRVRNKGIVVAQEFVEKANRPDHPGRDENSLPDAK
jgi:hypothetical protein